MCLGWGKHTEDTIKVDDENYIVHATNKPDIFNTSNLNTIDNTSGGQRIFACKLCDFQAGKKFDITSHLYRRYSPLVLYLLFYIRGNILKIIIQNRRLDGSRGLDKTNNPSAFLHTNTIKLKLNSLYVRGYF